VKVDGSNKGNYLMPNAFTPNGDGLNDCYRIKYWGLVEEVEFSIWNRWGERVFHSRDPFACWDGKFKGSPQSAGVFVYQIRAKTACEAEVIRKGTFALIR
jgi:gliding motility-associated-like protein